MLMDIFFALLRTLWWLRCAYPRFKRHRLMRGVDVDEQLRLLRNCILHDSCSFDLDQQEREWYAAVLQAAIERRRR